MTKLYCDLCKQEIGIEQAKTFFSEILLHRIKKMLIDPKHFGYADKLVEERLHLCQKCFEEKLGSVV